MSGYLLAFGIVLCQDKDTDDNSDSQDEGQDGAPPCGDGTDQPCETQKFQSLRGKDRKSLSLVRRLVVFFNPLMTICCL